MTSASAQRVPDRLRELGYVVLLVLGVSTVALGLAFGILGVTMRTQPPAPYMAVHERYLLIGVGGLITVGGAIVSRIAGHRLTK